jgi:hypothetical protein
MDNNNAAGNKPKGSVCLIQVIELGDSPNGA